MSGEITVLEGDGGRNYNLLFLFPISTPITFASANVVPTPSAGLSSNALLALNSTQKAALDAGTSAFRIKTLAADPALTGPQLATRVKEVYAAELSDFNSWYTATYKYIGTIINYP